MLALIGKKRIIFLLVILLLLTSYQFSKNINFFYFKINKIEFVNTYNLEENIKNRIIEYYLNKSLININIKKLKNILSDSNWVKNYSLKKKYPDTIIIQFQELKPIALFLKQNQYFFINENFYLTKKKFDYQKTHNYPVYTGQFDKNSFSLFYNFLIKSNFLQNIKEVKYNSYSYWELYTKKNIKILFGDYSYDKQFKILNLILKKNKSINLIDLRVENRAVVLNNE